MSAPSDGSTQPAALASSGDPGPDRWVELHGYRMRYLEAGEGPPLVHLHGAAAMSWDEAKAQLSARFRVIAPEFPGFGQSPEHESLRTVPDLAGLSADFIREVAGGRAHVIGSSFGGRVATWLVLQEPALVDRLVLEAPANNPREDGFLDRLSKIETPTLVVFGTEDATVPPEFGRIYRERMPDCSFVLIYGAGHVTRRDRPEAFVRAVGDFLERGPAFVVNRVSSA